jgi:hypothetical protein
MIRHFYLEHNVLEIAVKPDILTPYKLINAFMFIEQNPSYCVFHLNIYCDSEGSKGGEIQNIQM